MIDCRPGSRSYRRMARAGLSQTNPPDHTKHSQDVAAEKVAVKDETLCSVSAEVAQTGSQVKR